MSVNENIYSQIKKLVENKNILLIAVSKFQSIDKIEQLINLGHIHFGENYVQELVSKAKTCSADIHWHFIGHLQRNKVKELVPFVNYIHSVDSLELLTEIQKRAASINKTIKILFQLKIAQEATKFGLQQEDLINIIKYYKNNVYNYPNIEIVGLMGLTSLLKDKPIIRKEFALLKTIFDFCKTNYFPQQDSFKEISMGMSDDYEIAIQEGTTMIRVGSAIFGKRISN